MQKRKLAEKAYLNRLRTLGTSFDYYTEAIKSHIREHSQESYVKKATIH